MPSKRKARSPDTIQGKSPVSAGSSTQAITLILRPPASLQKKLNTLAKGSLTPLRYSEYLKRYGTPDKVLEQLEAWASSAQLQFVDADWKEQAKLSGAVRLTGAPSQVHAAFSLEKNSGTGARSLRTPKALDGLLLWVFGVEPRPVTPPEQLKSKPSPPPALRRTHIHLPPTRGVTKKARALPDKALTPLQIAEAYNYPANQGAGQCVGLVQLTGTYSLEDVQAYLSQLQVTPTPTIVDVNLGPTRPPSSADLEVTMDLELVASLCPESTIVVYNACSSNYSIRDFFDVFNAAVFDTENCPSVLSTSWAFPESVEGINSGVSTEYTITKEEEAAFNLLFAKAALLGITLCAASGDTGSLVPFRCDDTPSEGTFVPITYFPAASPFVLGCGGTQLAAGQNLPTNERVWNQLGEVLLLGSGPFSFPTVGGSSGGGVSFLNGPVSYQEGYAVPKNTVATWTHGVYEVIQRQQGRGVPDVAAYASPIPGYAIVLGGGPATGGGTSAAAPMWAALLTRVNAELGRRVGFLHPSLYRYQLERKKLCTTIKHGTNGAYHASEALWNACTGLGTPNGKELVRALKSG
ncbi:S53 family peptidase [Hyalangium sp.]|uniref:S53 family peptidase n=1 Tax=Hyalangium sp. TaxID=2028555 RepID=UPI002D2CFCF4|nr:S53 family peptidase [Hyalangium sp.]HYI01148.1 S53 family peptidase [Hyalangium sp.]